MEKAEKVRGKGNIKETPQKATFKPGKVRSSQVGPTVRAAEAREPSINASGMMGFLSRLKACLSKLRSGGLASAVDGAHEDDSSGLFFELRSLQIATNFFSELNQLGHGGFGPVYK
ncbi:hypothetical protein CRG98_035686, partial [Punica granatum]